MENYKIIEKGIDKNGEAYVLIEDTGIGMSITNAAKKVVEELTNLPNDFNIKGKHLFYIDMIDTDGQTDELLHDNNGNFKGFKFGNSIL